MKADEKPACKIVAGYKKAPRYYTFGSFMERMLVVSKYVPDQYDDMTKMFSDMETHPLEKE